MLHFAISHDRAVVVCPSVDGHFSGSGVESGPFHNADSFPLIVFQRGESMKWIEVLPPYSPLFP